LKTVAVLLATPTTLVENSLMPN